MEEEKNVEKTVEANEKIKPKKSKLRMVIVLIFIAIFLIVTFIAIRSNYLEYKELGANYENVFFTNLRYRLITTISCFAILYIIMYLTNRGIKKGIKPFFDAEKREMPKLPNKSISLIFASLASALIGTALMEKIILFAGNTSFWILYVPKTINPSFIVVCDSNTNSISCIFNYISCNYI